MVGEGHGESGPNHPMLATVPCVALNDVLLVSKRKQRDLASTREHGGSNRKWLDPKQLEPKWLAKSEELWPTVGLSALLWALATLLDLPAPLPSLSPRSKIIQSVFV